MSNYVDLPTISTAVEVDTAWQTVTTSTVITVTSLSTQLLPANPLRKFICISNNAANMVYIQLGFIAAYGHGIRLAVGASLILSGFDLFLGPINAIGITNTPVDVLEGE